jgi:phosphoglycerate-specific signal transduction histidine kinase
MQAIYTRTMRVKDDGLGKAMEIGKGLAKVRKKYYPNHEFIFHFKWVVIQEQLEKQLIGTMFEGDNDADAKMSADKKYQKLQKQLKNVAIEGTIEDEIRPYLVNKQKGDNMKIIITTIILTLFSSLS